MQQDPVCKLNLAAIYSANLLIHSLTQCCSATCRCV